jgi:hypothetical protein
MFVVVWLNMALQPCLMAAGPALPAPHEHGDCPHCPEDAHHGQAGGGRCAYIEDFDFDGRAPQLPDTLSMVAVTAPDWQLPALPTGAAPAAPQISALVRDGPRLHLRHCVFLN